LRPTGEHSNTRPYPYYNPGLSSQARAGLEKIGATQQAQHPIDNGLGIPHHEIVKSFLNASEVARLFGVDRATITRWIQKGMIKGAVRPAGSQKWMIPLTAYEELVKMK
jgi:hypothetical protein